MVKSNQLLIFPKKFIVEPYELVKYRFEIEAEDGWDAQRKAIQIIKDWNGSNTENIIERSQRSCNRITDEKGQITLYSS